MLDFCTTFGGHITFNQILSRKKVCRQELGGFCGSYFQNYHEWIMRDAMVSIGVDSKYHLVFRVYLRKIIFGKCGGFFVGDFTRCPADSTVGVSPPTVLSK